MKSNSNTSNSLENFNILKERIFKAKEKFMDSATRFSESWERKRKREELKKHLGEK